MVGVVEVQWQFINNIIYMKRQGANFVPVQRLDESKEEAQGLFSDRPARDGHKSARNLQTTSHPSNFSRLLLVLLSIVLFAVILIAINEHYSKTQNKISGQEPIIVAKPNDASIYQGMHQQPLSTLYSDNSNASPNALKKEFDDLSKQVTLIKKDISTLSKAIEKDHSNISKELGNLKSFIFSNGEKGPAQSVQEQSNDDRSYEADFAETSPNDTAEKFTSSSEIYVDNKYIFNIPKKLWLYETEISTYMSELIHNNNVYFGKKSNYDVVILSRNNYKKYLSQKGVEAIQKLISVLEKRIKAGQNSNLKFHLQGIIKKLILLTVLKENGGVMTNGEYAMTEDFKWINDIVRNQYVNRGNRGIKPQVVGFYVPYYSFEKAKENIKPFEGMHPVDKYMIIFPTLEHYFMAAAPNTPFLNALLTQITKLLTNPSGFKRERAHYKFNHLNGDDIYYEYIFIASQIVLQEKQKLIDLASIDQYRHFAIDYYGLNLINCHYAPQKFKVFWGNGQSNKIFQSLSQYTIEQLEANIGPMRYIVRLNPVAEMNRFLQDTKNGKRKMILDGSFIQKIFYPDSNAAFLKKNQEEQFVNQTSEPWLALPKIIWIFWDEGLSNAFVNNQLCVQNLRRKGKESGFELREVNMSNAHQYLDQKTLDKINYTMKNAKLKSSRQHLSDFMRLALVSKYGGIYVDASYIALQNLDWIINIGKYPSQYIFNRYGTLPKVLMIWHPHYGAPLDWSIDLNYNTKSQWHLAYQSNFIAAEKGSEFVTEWFQLMMELYVKPYSQVEKIFQDCLIFSHKWMTSGSHYLIVMDTVKCVVGRREAQLRKKGSRQYVSASDYYKVWSISGYLGQQKFRSNTNFDYPGSEDNKLVYMYSQDYVEGIIGKIRHLVKFYSQHNKELNLFVSRHMDGNFSSETHPDSFFMRHMWDKRYKLKKVNSYARLMPLK